VQTLLGTTRWSWQRASTAALSALFLLAPTSAFAGLAYRLDFITPPAGVQAYDAADINDHGLVVGTSGDGASYDGYQWSRRDGFVTLPRIAGADSMTAVAINNRGWAVGNAEWNDGFQTRHPVLWTDATHAQDLGVYGRYVFIGPDSSWFAEKAIATDVSDGGYVVGSTSSPEFGEVAYRWDARNGMQLLGTFGGAYSTAWGVNSWGDVVGGANLPDGTHHAFLWSNGVLRDLGALSGSYSDAYSINDWGEVTGIYQTPGGDTRVFRWTRHRGMVDVGPTYPNRGEGITSLSTRVNLIGQIVGGIFPTPGSIRAAVRQPFSGAWQELSPGSAFTSFALGVNNLGTIVGRVATSLDEEAPMRAAIWTPVFTFP